MACCSLFIMRVTPQRCCRVFPHHHQETFGNHTLDYARLSNPKMGPKRVAPQWREEVMRIRASVGHYRLCVSDYHLAPAGNF